MTYDDRAVSAALFFRFDPCTDFALCDVVFFIVSTIGRNRMSAFDKIIGQNACSPSTGAFWTASPRRSRKSAT